MENVNSPINIISSLDKFERMVSDFPENPIRVNPQFITANLILVDQFDPYFHLLEDENSNIRSVPFQLYCDVVECGVDAYLADRDQFMTAYESAGGR